jgi:redox-sensitive bicupin YhaK (pirin superfamily)
MRSIKKIHQARYAPIADLVTYSVLPTTGLDYIDPFLFLNHHGPQTYPPHNHGLPFGPHPHRGMETVTFILDGDIMHEDSAGHRSVITAGGVQWMTAGRGLIHAEVSSPSFKKSGGPLEILQLWVNLPTKYKMTAPKYSGLQKNEVPSLALDDGRVIANVISGNLQGVAGAVKPLTDVSLQTIEFKAGGKLSLSIAATRNIFFYLIKGNVELNGHDLKSFQLAEADNDSDVLQIHAKADSIVLFGHATPLNEPVVARGPFVMNSEEEIREAYEDYQRGMFGNWKGE